jgi:hypothetical protein
MWYALLADLIVAIHIAYVAYIIVGLGLILLGLWRRWKWIGNRWFRLTHLLAILVVVFELILKANCPLTVWEASLRVLARQPVNGAAFMDRLMAFVLFAAAPGWVTNGLYFVFALTTVAVFVLAPPKFGIRNRERQVKT